MTLINASSVATKNGSSLLTLMEESSQLDQKSAKEKKESHFDEKIRLQENQVKTMEEKIKATFKGGLFKTILTTVVEIGISIANTVIDTKTKVGNFIKENVLNIIGKAAGFFAENNPFLNKANKLGVEEDKQQIEINKKDHLVQKASEEIQKTNQQDQRIYQIMTSVINNNKQASQAIAKG